MTNAYLDLARRCEEASGPDRDLDFAIYAALNPDKDTESIRRSYRYLYGQPYSASLDAAMSLVPEGALFDVGHFGDEKPGIFIASILPSRSPTQASEAATPALALCAASLRAKGAGENE